MGMIYTIAEVPAEMKEEVEHWREKMVEAVAEFDDTLMEKYFADPDSITEADLVPVIRKATIAMTIIPMLCGSAFKNKGVQAMLDAVIKYLPSPMDIESVIGINPDTEQEEQRH